MTGHDVIDDLQAEYEALDEILGPLTDADFDLPTPAEGWTVRDQIAHLAFSEELASLAASDPDAFADRLGRLFTDLGTVTEEQAARARATSPSELVEWWRRERARTVEALRAHGPRDRIPWVGPDMSTVSFATARLMETWAHGQDVVDALDATRPPTARLRHVAEIGVRTRRFGYVNRGLAPPEGDVRVELEGPDGERWTWGAGDAPDRVTGSALDFCLVVTQRRHLADTALSVEGPLAAEWMSIAQAFAGPPTEGRPAARGVS